MRVRAGSLEELRKEGRLLTKVGSLPVVVFWSDDRAWAIEDRCPHMGFPLHQGTVESGLITCHWHHARFDLVTGCTLEPVADDARGFEVTIDGGDVLVEARRGEDPVTHLFQRLDDGLEMGLSLVLAKSVLGLLEAGITPDEIVRRGIAFGTRYRDSGWGAGLTVLVAMANVLPSLAPDDRALALVHGLAFVARDTRNHPPRFPMRAFDGFSEDGSGAHEQARLASWYRRFVETRSADAAELVLTTALARPGALGDVERMMFAAVTDHVFVDGGHTIDFTNKAFESLGYVGRKAAGDVLPTLGRGTASASWSEQSGTWRHPHDLPALVARAQPRLDEAISTGATRHRAFTDVTGLAWQLLTTLPSGSSTRCSTPSPPAPIPSSWGGRSRSPPRCASPASTCRTTSATGTPCTTRSPPRTRCTARWVASRRASCTAGSCTARCASTSTASSTCPRRASPTRRPATSGTSTTAGRSRVPSTAPAASPPGTSAAGATRPGSSPRSATRCCGKTPSSTGTRCSRRPSPSSTAGPSAPRRASSSSPASPASSPPTPRPAASSPASSTSPPASAAARSSSPKPDPPAVLAWPARDYRRGATPNRRW